jgi:hypothetical protein
LHGAARTTDVWWQADARLSRQVAERPPRRWAATANTAIVLVFFAVDTLNNEPETFIAIVAIALPAIILDLLWKRSRGARP